MSTNTSSKDIGTGLGKIPGRLEAAGAAVTVVIIAALLTVCCIPYGRRLPVSNVFRPDDSTIIAYMPSQMDPAVIQSRCNEFVLETHELQDSVFHIKKLSASWTSPEQDTVMLVIKLPSAVHLSAESRLYIVHRSSIISRLRHTEIQKNRGLSPTAANILHSISNASDTD